MMRLPFLTSKIGPVHGMRLDGRMRRFLHDVPERVRLLLEQRIGIGKMACDIHRFGYQEVGAAAGQEVFRRLGQVASSEYEIDITRECGAVGFFTRSRNSGSARVKSLR